MKATKMPITPCHTCGGEYFWTWPEAFNKFGFNDGDADVMTFEVEKVLRNAGYTVTTDRWGLHNVVIDSIMKTGEELIPHDTIRFGYDDPRDYLPEDVIALLDRELPDNEGVV